MQKQIKLNNISIEYQLRTNSRTRQLRLSVYHDGRVVVSRPVYFSERRVRKMMREKSPWIIDKLNLLKKRSTLSPSGNYSLDKTKAKILIRTRLEYFSSQYGFKYQRLSIRNQKTRWGSCSKQGNLNFNYRLLYLSDKLRDYIIIHELCHLQEFNHSPKFWQLVAEIVPDYEKMRQKLKSLKM